MRLPIIAAVIASVAALFTAMPSQAATGCTADNARYDWNGQHSGAIGDYYADADLWGAYDDYQQRMLVCAPGNWNATVTASSHGGAVQAYPNVHKDYHNWSTGHEPKIASFKRITSRWAAKSPHVGIYDVAYDIWINGVADSGSTEVMIWTDNYKQEPAGHVVASGLKFNHRTWDVWSDNDGYIAFVPDRPKVSGNMHLLRRFHWLHRHGFIPDGSTVGQIDFGVETVSSGGGSARFDVTNFSITDAKK